MVQKTEGLLFVFESFQWCWLVGPKASSSDVPQCKICQQITFCEEKTRKQFHTLCLVLRYALEAKKPMFIFFPKYCDRLPGSSEITGIEHIFGQFFHQFDNFCRLSFDEVFPGIFSSWIAKEWVHILRCCYLFWKLFSDNTSWHLKQAVQAGLRAKKFT